MKLQKSYFILISFFVMGHVSFASIMDPPVSEMIQFREQPQFNLKKVSPSELPSIEIDDAEAGSWEAGSKEGFKQAITRQLQKCTDRNAQEVWNFAGKKIKRVQFCQKTAQWFLKKIETAKNLNEVYVAAKSELDWYQSTGNPVLFTGYHYPELKVRKKPSAEYSYPIYSMPKDLVLVNVNGAQVYQRKVCTLKFLHCKYLPYYSRKEINEGALSNQGLELGYASNPVDPYMMQVQGSGILLREDETGQVEKILVNYAGQNGYAYSSLGKIMRAAGIPEEYINLQGIQRYFIKEHPEKWLEMSNQNQSYVFFKEAKDGPYGSGGVILTPKHSIAVDTKEFTMGMMGLVRTERPIRIEGTGVDAKPVEWKSFAQFVVTQDTGGAIKTPARVDIYWGGGEYADVTAGNLAHPGELFFAVVPELLR